MGGGAGANGSHSRYVSRLGARIQNANPQRMPRVVFWCLRIDVELPPAIRRAGYLARARPAVSVRLRRSSEGGGGRPPPPPPPPPAAAPTTPITTTSFP